MLIEQETFESADANVSISELVLLIKIFFTMMAFAVSSKKKVSINKNWTRPDLCYLACQLYGVIFFVL